MNYVLIRSETEVCIVINKHKTVDTYGGWRERVPERLARLICEYVTQEGLPTDGSRRLFCTADPDDLTLMLGRIGIPPCGDLTRRGYNYLRHSYVSSQDRRDANLRSALALKMKHSERSAVWYWRVICGIWRLVWRR
jgi:hypothetical protein